MTSTARSRSCVALVLLATLPLACLGPNPLLEAGEEESETRGDGDGDSETMGDGDGDTGGDGDGDSDTTGDGDTDTDTMGDGDGEPDGPCNNGMMDGDETDVDCGGSCSPCDDGLTCLEPEDCASQICDEGVCAEPSCDDEVMNGAEVGVDCGGDCTFCTYSPFLSELDAFEGSSAEAPHVEMFSDFGFAVSYRGTLGARLAWFDEQGDSEGPITDLSVDVMLSGIQPVYFAVDTEADDEHVHSIMPGVGPMSFDSDIFLLRHSSEEQLVFERVNDVNAATDTGDIVVSGTTATVGWLQGGDALLRRYDYSIGQGNWSDINPLEAEAGAGALGVSKLAMNAEGTIAMTWARCSMDGCQVVARRFGNGGWLDDVPVVIADSPGLLGAPQIALGDDGTAFVAWYATGTYQARMLDSDFEVDGDVWTLQEGLMAIEPFGVAALSDGSFAIGWGDSQQGRVHLSRYVGPDTFKNPNYADEGPWNNLDNPRDASIATHGNRLVVVWTATVDMVDQIQGQVLSF